MSMRVIRPKHNRANGHYYPMYSIWIDYKKSTNSDGNAVEWILIDGIWIFESESDLEADYANYLAQKIAGRYI